MGAAATSLAIASMGMTKAASALGSIASAAKGAMGSSSGMDAVKSADFGSIGENLARPGRVRAYQTILLELLLKDPNNMTRQKYR